MTSGSPAQDGRGWPATQHPYQDEAIGGPVHYGSGPRSDPLQGPDGRRDVPYGPELSWPSGFRAMDAQTRDVLEAGYGTGPYREVDPRYSAPRRPGRDYGTGSGYQQPAMEDYGYGDPGYSDPSYDGPRHPHGGSGIRSPRGHGVSDPRVPGYQVPDDRQGRSGYQQEFAGPSAGDRRAYPGTGGHEAHPGTGSEAYPGTGGRAAYLGDGGRAAYPGDGGRAAYPGDGGGQDIYPTTGAMEALTATDPFGPTGALGSTGAFGSPGAFESRGSSGSAGSSASAVSAGFSALGQAPDPRLEGLRYDELRYDEPSYDEPSYDEPGFDKPLDDASSWIEELRRSAPVYPDRPGGRPRAEDRPGAGDRSRTAEPQRGTGPLRRPADQPSGYPQAPARDQGFGQGQPRQDRGGSRPQMSTGPAASGPYPGSSGPGPRMATGPGSRPSAPAAPAAGGPAAGGPGAWLGGPAQVPPASWAGALSEPKTARQPAAAFSTGPALDATAFLSAPTVQVGVLTPPDGTRLDDMSLLDSPSAVAGQLATPWVRPGHGLDGPEITSSWPAQPEPQADDLEAFWRDDEDDDDYSGLFADDGDLNDRRATSARSAKRGIGRRGGRSNDHRLWLALAGVVIAAAAAITGIIKFEFPSHSGPVHAMSVPNQIGTYARTVNLEHQADLTELRDEVIKMSAGQASGVVSALYESGNSAAGGTTQIVMFIGGHLAHAAPASSIAGFMHSYPGAFVVGAGSLGGEAACVESRSGTSDSVGMCVWFDDDSFGELVSPTMTARALGNEMLTIRSAVEQVVKK